MAKLIDVLAKELAAWPDDVDKFWCDPDGEIRGCPRIHSDFYPDSSVDDDERGTDFGDMGVTVTKEQWEQAKNVA